MATTTLAAQLYTLRDFLKTPRDIAASLKKVRKIGYQAVQASGLGKIEPAELAKILKEEGLTCCATHVGMDRLADQAKAVIEEHQRWGCKYTAIGGYFENAVKASDWIAFATKYNKVVSQFEGSGFRVGYHNHSHEFVKLDGKTAMQILLDNLSPAVWMEIDTYWVQHGGADPAAWITKVAGRIPCVHLKDMGISPDRAQMMAEVGEGNLNWPAILDACRKAGVEWYIVEQDVCQRDPFESLEISLKNLKQMGLQ